VRKCEEVRMGMWGVGGGEELDGSKGRWVVRRPAAVKRGERLTRMQAGEC